MNEPSDLLCAGSQSLRFPSSAAVKGVNYKLAEYNFGLNGSASGNIMSPSFIYYTFHV